MDYTSWVNQIANMVPIGSTDAGFTTMLPGAIDYAEGRCYRELNLVDTIVRDSSLTFTANSRTLTLPSAVSGSSGAGFVTVTGVSVITPSTGTAATGTRNQLVRAWQTMVDFLYPSDTSTGAGSIPSIYAYVGSSAGGSGRDAIIVGPPPGAAYAAELTGTIRPTALSSTNTTTFLSNYLPELFMAASMVYVSGYMRNFGAQADDPKMSQSWESQYQTLLQSAVGQETRKRYSEHINGPDEARARG